MSQSINRQIILVSRPQGMPAESDFKLIETLIPRLKAGEVLIKSVYISVDPYMRMKMMESLSYISQFELNEPMNGQIIGRIEESKNTHFKQGDYVLGMLPWSDYTVSNGENIKKVDPSVAPVSAYLGVLGTPGLSAYFGLLEIGQPKPGETVVVSAAAGAVGSIAGQIAKIKGCRVVGIAGSDVKVKYITEELGFDAGINYRNPDYAEMLKKACPKDVDIYFDNVGGDVTDQVINLLNKFARIVVCGQISTYNLDKLDMGPRSFRTLIVKSAMAKGFLVWDYQDRFQEGIKQMAEWIKQGKIKYRENIIEGLENTPKAFIALFKGENIGKQIVKV